MFDSEICCPKCCNQLDYENGKLICRKEHGPFIVHSEGFIQFIEADDPYFKLHWEVSESSDVPESKRQVGLEFLQPLLKSNSETCLDVGTGDGVHLSLLQELMPSTRLFGLDISRSGLATCSKRVPGSTLLLADGQNIPLADNSIAATFSYGVLGYMPEPWLGLAEMVRVTRSGGLIGVWMYPKKDSFIGTVFSIFRLIVPRLPYFLQARVADLIVPFLGFLPTAGKLSLGNASWQACREVVLVNIAPVQLFFPEKSEILEQLKLLNCKVLVEDSNIPITIWAVKD